jgi:hypothetical protein
MEFNSEMVRVCKGARDGWIDGMMLGVFKFIVNI